MGLLVAQITKEQLIQYKSQLEERMMAIRQAKISLDESVADLTKVGNDMDPESPVVKQLEQRKKRLNLLEEQLNKEMEAMEIRLKMVEKNIEAADKMIDSSIK